MVKLLPEQQQKFSIFNHMHIRSHEQILKYFLSVAVTDLQRYQHSSPWHKYCISPILEFSRKPSMIRVKTILYLHMV